MTVVFDTNVFVSAAISQTGLARRCFVLLCDFKFVVRQNMMLSSNNLQRKRHFCFDANPYAIGRRGLRRNRNVWAAASFDLSHWQLESKLPRRRFQLAVTTEILAEYETAAEELTREPGKFHGMNWRPLFRWLHDKAVYFEPAPLGKQRSRDASDDIFLACALAAGAKIIVSYDEDLLVLGKPFGIEILKPAIFVARFRAVAS